MTDQGDIPGEPASHAGSATRIPPGGPPAAALVFLDVDGTLLPIGAHVPPGRERDWGLWQSTENQELAGVDRALGPRLRALPGELVWASAWMHDANEVIAPLLGLPALPVAAFPEVPDEDPADAVHWKLPTLLELADGRPFAWIDDEITAPDRDWVARHHDGPALLHRVPTAVGVRAADLEAVDAWLRAHAR